MFKFHRDKKRYFDIQYKVSLEYLIPFLEPHTNLTQKSDILEIGCGEAGVLKAFTDKGHRCVGIELSPSRVKWGEQFLAREIKEERLRFITRNIYDIEVKKDIGHGFDLVVLKDVIEHIPDQEKFLPCLKNFLKPGGKIFFAFPPWQMPFGGHQQICQSRFLSKLPYFHLLPNPLYKGILKLFGEKEPTIKELMDIKKTGISIERFERILGKSGFNVIERKLFLINPIYKYKFNLKPRMQFGALAKIPYVRNFFSTAAYYLIKDRTDANARNYKNREEESTFS